MSDSENEDGVFENITKKKYTRKVEAIQRELVEKKEELQNMKAEYEREKLKNDIIIAEKKVVELKLKLKTQEYDELLKLNKPNDNMTKKVSIGIQTIEKEPSTTVVETVKATASAPMISSAATASAVISTAKKGVKRKQENIVEPKSPKRRANSNISDTTLATAQEAPLDLSKNIYNCHECMNKWGEEVKEKFRYRDTSGDYPRYRTMADKSKAPDPKLEIKRFTNIDDYVKHLDTVHGWRDGDIKKGKCGIAFLIPWQEPDREYNYTPDGNNICKICDARFDVQARYDQHFELEHADLDTITKTKLYDLWFKYDDVIYARFEPENLERFKEESSDDDYYW